MMADQIKNQNAGEVSSPATEAKSPARKEPVFAEPKEVSLDGEGKPEKNLPVFKDKEENKPEKNFPTFKEKERKLPVFTNEVKQYEEDEDMADDDFTSDSVAMPFSVGAPVAAAATVAVDASDIAEDVKKDKKQKKKNKEKNKKEKAAPSTVVEQDKAQLASMDQADELSLMGGTMPSVVPFGSEGYLDLNPNSTSYVPSYEQENALMAKHYKNSEQIVKELEPLPEKSPSDDKNGKKDKKAKKETVKESKPEEKASAKKEHAVDPGIEEASAMLADNAAYNNQPKPKKADKADSKDSKTQTTSEPETESESPAESKSEPETKSKAKSGKPVDPGIEEAAALMAAYAEEKARLKALKLAKKNKTDEPATVVEVADNSADNKEVKEEKAENVQSAAPLTAAETPKKVVLFIPEDNGNADAGKVGIVAPADVDVEAYTTDGEKAEALPLTKKEISTEAYDKKREKSEKNADIEALAVVFGEQNVKKSAKHESKAEKNENSYADAEAYVVETKPEQAKKEPKFVAPVVVSTDKYDSKNQKKLDKKAAHENKKAEREALAVVYGEEKAKEVAKTDTKATKETANEEALAVVYGDIEPFEAPVKAEPAKATKEPKATPVFSHEGYTLSEQKKIEKKEAKAEKKAEQAALLAVAAAEKQKAKEDKAAA